MKPKYPWDEIRAKWESGQYTMQELSDEYGFNRSYGHQRAKKKGWEKGKHAEEIKQKAQEKAKERVVEEEATREAELRKEYSRILDNLRRATANELFQTDSNGEVHTNFDRLKELKIGSQIIHNVRQEQWEVAEIREVSEKIEEQGADRLGELVGAIENAPVKE